MSSQNSQNGSGQPPNADAKFGPILAIGFLVVALGVMLWALQPIFGALFAFFQALHS